MVVDGVRYSELVRDDRFLLPPQVFGGQTWLPPTPDGTAFVGSFLGEPVFLELSKAGTAIQASVQPTGERTAWYVRNATRPINHPHH